jgi:phenylalanine ammonia-lyase
MLGRFWKLPSLADVDDNIVCLGRNDLTIGDVFEISLLHKKVALPSNPDFASKLKASSDLVTNIFKNKMVAYGINTNFGGLAKGTISEGQAVELQDNLLWGLRCGMGPQLESHYVRAAMAIRTNTLAKGVSSIRQEILERILLFLNHSVTPKVRALGSIGASGDLVPLSYIASSVIGLDPSYQVEFKGGTTDCITALKDLGLEPIKLRPKEGLALVNGTAVLSGIAALVCHDFRLALQLTFFVNALFCQALQASVEAFDGFLHELKPHRGQVGVAAQMRLLLEGSKSINGGPESRSKECALAASELWQDQYSIRCIPQYFGPLLEGLDTISKQIEVEINSADDNPLCDVERKRFIHGGNFYGQYIGLAMDQLRQYVALSAKQLDVQIALLATPEFSRGLPPSLSVGNAEILFGLKGLQIAGNSILPRLLHLGNPIVLLFPTHAEQFNQNVNSQGFNASMLSHEAVNLYWSYLAAAIVFGIQGVELRSHTRGLGYDARAILSPLTRRLYLAGYKVMMRSPRKERPLIDARDRAAIDVLTDRLVEDLKNPLGKILAILR